MYNRVLVLFVMLRNDLIRRQAHGLFDPTTGYTISGIAGKFDVYPGTHFGFSDGIISLSDLLLARRAAS